MLFLLLAVQAVSVAAQPHDTVMTFQNEDPFTGLPVLCDRCPPGTYLRYACTAKQKSDCAQCPPGSFTELWNHITKCLRCGVCGENEVVKKNCSPEHDCVCECKEGYFFKKRYDMCIRHTECPSGHGIVSKGTPMEDTVCQVCPSGFYSVNTSAHHNCTAHTNCEASGQRLVLKGCAWHDNVCTTCNELKTRDGADYLREIIPAFFVHRNMPIKRLRRFVLKNPPKEGEKLLREKVLQLPRRDLYSQINSWVHQANTKQLRLLPKKLRRVGAVSAAEKLERKLNKIDSQMTQICKKPIDFGDPMTFPLAPPTGQTFNIQMSISPDPLLI